MTEASSEPRDAKLKLSSSSTLRPTAKAFVFNTAAPEWTPASCAVTKSSELNLSAKPFVPSYSAPEFVPASLRFTESPVKTNVVERIENGKTSEVSTSRASSVSEPEVDDMKKDEKLIDSNAIQNESEKVIECDSKSIQNEELNNVEKLIDCDSNAIQNDESEDQTVICERILYTIKQLLELEPQIEHCIMPAQVQGLVCAAEKTTRALSAIDEAKTSVRALTRSNSSDNFRRTGRNRGRNTPVETAPALEDCAPLETNEETRWKPSHSKSRLDDPLNTTEVSLKEAKAVLNKLSIEKFDKLSDQLIAVAVRGIDVLKGVIAMVIAKAQVEWHFAAMYATLCAKLAKTGMPAITLEEGKVVTDTPKLFRKLLLQRCQEEFETKVQVENLENLSKDERLEKELILKRASLGHIRFVGELFKQRMLSSRIMHECVQILLGELTAPDEESLECLCNLLTTMGQTLELNAREEAEVQFINGYYKTMKKLSTESTLLSTRVRFMLQDLLELRSNRWIARRKETKAMTIAQVHAEIAREAKEKERNKGSGRLQRSQSMNTFSMTDRRRGNSTPGGTKSRPPASADGWETVTTGTRGKSSKHRSNSDRFPPSMASRAGPPLSNNVFASLTTSSRKSRGRCNSSSSLRGQEESGRPPKASTPVDNSGCPPKVNAPVDDGGCPPKVTLSADAFLKKVKVIVEEFVELTDLEEVVTSLDELKAKEHYSLIPEKVLNMGLEKGAKERQAIATLLLGLYERHIVTSAALESALQDLLQEADELAIDTPKVLPYLSEMMAPCIAAGSLPLVTIVSLADHLRENGKAATFMGTLLSEIATCENEAKVQDLLAVDTIELMALLAERNRNDEGVDAFYRTHALEFLA